MWNPFGWLKNKAEKEAIKLILKYVLKEVSKMSWLSGNKTYILSILGAIGAVINISMKFLNGEPISMDDIYILLGSFGLGTLRAGISKGK